MKKPRPTVVEKIQAKQAEFRVDTADIQRLVGAARLGLQHLGGDVLVNASLAVARVEAALAQPLEAEKKPEPPNAG